MIEASSSLIVNIGILIIVAAVISYIAKKLGQPLILAYILAGILLGLFFADSIGSLEQVKVLSQLGIVFLLFMVGLELSFGELKNIAKSSLIVGLGQLIFTFGIGFWISTLLGFGVVASFYISMQYIFTKQYSRYYEKYPFQKSIN